MSVTEWFCERDEERWDRVKQYLVPKPPIALRVWDFLVCTYIRLHRVEITLPCAMRPEQTMVNNAYEIMQNTLLGMSKKKCDPFRRLHADDEELIEFRGIRTTRAQLNFFRLALIYGVVTYMEQNYDRIVDEMKTLKTKHCRFVNAKARDHIKKQAMVQQAKDRIDVLADDVEQSAVAGSCEKMEVRTSAEKKRRRIVPNSAWDTRAMFSSSQFSV